MPHTRHNPSVLGHLYQRPPAGPWYRRERASRESGDDRRLHPYTIRGNLQKG